MKLIYQFIVIALPVNGLDYSLIYSIEVGSGIGLRLFNEFGSINFHQLAKLASLLINDGIWSYNNSKQKASEKLLQFWLIKLYSFALNYNFIYSNIK